jgi:hypothetical protein
MMRLRWILLVPGALFGSTGAAQVDDSFDAGQLNTGYWCACQLDVTNAPVEFLEERGTKFARITVKSSSLGGNKCVFTDDYNECADLAAGAPLSFATAESIAPEAPDLPESLGRSFFAPRVPAELLRALPGMKPAPKYGPATPYCSNEEHYCYQRQELRLTGYKPDAETAQEYSLLFRMPRAAEIMDRENSIRWVIAQWKEKPLDPDYVKNTDTDPSPFLALRFDDAVLHLTVQQGDCRCLVASEPHPTKEIDGWTPDNHGGSVPVWTKNLACQSTKTGAPPGQSCKADFDVLYGDQPLLSSPLGTWVDLTLRVKAGPDGYVEVEQDGRFIVKVSGEIGYPHVKSSDPRERTKVKFKVGHYRDYLPFPAFMDIDRLEVEPLDNP